MKLVQVTVTFGMEIPDNMKVDSLADCIEDEVLRNLDSFRASARFFQNQENNEPLFEKDKIFFASNYVISISK